MNAITYYSEAIKKVDEGEITIGEYERLIKVLRDVEPVVRCRDCKYHDGIRCFRWNSTIITGFDDFCSNSERKDGDHHEG